MKKLIPIFLTLMLLFSACNGFASPTAAIPTHPSLPSTTTVPAPTHISTTTPTPTPPIEDYKVIDYSVTVCFDVDRDDLCGGDKDLYPDMMTVFLKVYPEIDTKSILTNENGLATLTINAMVEIEPMFDPEAIKFRYNAVDGCPSIPANYHRLDRIEMVNDIPTRIIQDELWISLCGPDLPPEKSA